MANLSVTGPSVTSATIADGSIVNADVNASAAIAYSKLALTGSVTNTDVASNAAIPASKLSVTVRTGAGVPAGAPTTTELPLAYDTTAVTGGFYYWNGAAWVKVATIL